MNYSALIIDLRKKALESLEDSTGMFERAFALLEYGDLIAAARVRASARAKHAEAACLMAQANNLDESSTMPANTIEPALRTITMSE